MSLRKEPAHSSGIFYGWYIVAASFAILFFNSGARFSFGVMFKPMMAELGWSRGSMSLAFFLNMVFYAVSLIAPLTATLVGKLYGFSNVGQEGEAPFLIEERRIL